MSVDITAGASRKEGVEDAGNASGSQTVDFDAGTADQKRYTLTATTAISLTATRAGKYQLQLTQAGPSRLTVRIIPFPPSSASVDFDNRMLTNFIPRYLRTI